MTQEQVSISSAGNWWLADPMWVFAVINSCIIYWASVVCRILCWGLSMLSLYCFCLGGRAGSLLLCHGFSSCSVQPRLALTRWTFVGKVMSLLLSMLSRLVITFLPRSKRLLISWLQSPSVVIVEPRKIKSGTVSTVSPSIPMK